jgi:hypothetical protein
MAKLANFSESARRAAYNKTLSMRMIRRTRYTHSPIDQEYDVFVLGAGFSRSIDKSMPLTKELTARMIEHLAGYIDPERIEEIPFLNEDFEKGLSYLAEGQPWLSESERLHNRALFLDVSDAIHQVLVGSQDAVLRAQTVCPSWLQSLVFRMHSDRAVVISFNYDTLLEMALSELCFGGGDLYLSDYLRPFAFPARQGHFANSTPPTVQLLKLHGSLHWTYSGTEEYFGQTIEDTALPRWSVAAGNKLPFILEDGRVPLLVPPTLNKNKYFDNEKIRWLWRRAALALSGARRVFCVGYSLPAGDLLMRFLLHDSKPTCNRIIPFWLVNSDGKAAEHYKEALPKWCKLVDTYVCDGDGGVVRRFADDFVSDKFEALNVPSSGTTKQGIRDFVRTVLENNLKQRDFIDDSEFEIRRVDDCGLLLSDLSDGGVRLLPWFVCENMLRVAGGGKYDQPGPNERANKDFLTNKLTCNWDRQIFSILVNVGALITTEFDGKMQFRPLPQLEVHLK